MAMTSESLDQIALVLRDDRTQSIQLKGLLTEICILPEYDQWIEDGQFEGQMFQLPSSFRSSHIMGSRLIQDVNLVIDNRLQVKINYLDDEFIFVTDGAFVDAADRVFPWHDESDLLIKTLTNEGWRKWPTIVVDPATGCGHNALRVAAERFGFDSSERALKFATINSMLNARSFSILGTSDVDKGIKIRSFEGPEKILFIVNMPFALEPLPGSLPLTSSGGKDGCEKTILALNAIERFMKRLPRNSEVRALILTYSVGASADNRWVVVDHAQRLFGPTSVRWRMPVDQGLWRINGRKEQCNPMSLSNLILKADCKLDITSPQMREALRLGYIEKEGELRSRGYDSLSYGILLIE
jgi:hypothetical protein